MKVNFLIVGAQKGGTSALDAYLRKHNDIEMAKQKEVHFFDNENNFVKSANYKQYHQSFDNCSSKTIKGEATPIYMYWYDAAKRIWEYNTEMKLIAILRNPIDRAFSHWNMERDRGADSLSFSQAIRSESLRCQQALPLQHRVYSYIDRGFYTEQIRRLWHFFPKEQTLIIKNEDLKHRLADVLEKISDFLGIKAFSEIQHKETHAREYITQMSKDDYLYLHDIFYYEIKALEVMLGWDCCDWLEPRME